MANRTASLPEEHTFVESLSPRTVTNDLPVLSFQLKRLLDHFSVNGLPPNNGWAIPDKLRALEQPYLAENLIFGYSVMVFNIANALHRFFVLHTPLVPKSASYGY